MKKPEYIEGPEARENFERGMIALSKAPKPAIGKAMPFHNTSEDARAHVQLLHLRLRR